MLLQHLGRLLRISRDAQIRRLCISRLLSKHRTSALRSMIEQKGPKRRGKTFKENPPGHKRVKGEFKTTGRVSGRIDLKPRSIFARGWCWSLGRTDRRPPGRLRSWSLHDFRRSTVGCLQLASHRGQRDPAEVSTTQWHNVFQTGD